MASGDNKHNKNGSCIDDDDGGFGDDGKAHDDDVGEVGSGDLEEGRMRTWFTLHVNTNTGSFANTNFTAINKSMVILIISLSRTLVSKSLPPPSRWHTKGLETCNVFPVGFRRVYWVAPGPNYVAPRSSLL